MTPEESVCHAICNDNADLLRNTLLEHPALRTRLNDPAGPFDSPLILSVRSRGMLDVLLDAGADINAKSRWWAGGFCLLDSASDELSAYAVQRGAVVEAHAAARLGWMDRLREIVGAHPESVNARGGDGQTPLHFARNVEVASFLLQHGAEIDARDIDHESTPVQWMIGERQEVARYLVERGAATDIFIAAALGDIPLARKHLEMDPNCLRRRVNEDCFPMRNPRAGGTIYQWTLGFHVSPHDVARKFGHDEVLKLLIEQSPPEMQLIDACWAGEEALARSLLAAHPGGLVATMNPSEKKQLADAARNNRAETVRLMLMAGWPTDVRGQHHATPLHWAAWHGNAKMVINLLSYDPNLEDSENDFHGTPMDWAIHGSENGWERKTGDYVATIQALLAKGARVPKRQDGSEEVKKLLAAQSK